MTVGLRPELLRELAYSAPTYLLDGLRGGEGTYINTSMNNKMKKKKNENENS